MRPDEPPHFEAGLWVLPVFLDVSGGDTGPRLRGADLEVREQDAHVPQVGGAAAPGVR